MATRYGETLFRSRLEARWAAFFDLASIGWEYEPKANIAGWWPDFKVDGVRVEDDTYSVLVEVKPVAFSPIAVDPRFNKAMHEKWTMCLGYGPDGDYVGFLVSKRDSIRTIGIRLGCDGLEAAPLGLFDYGSYAEKLWRQTPDKVPDAGVSAAINGVIQRNMGKKLFDFGRTGPDTRRISNAEENDNIGGRLNEASNENR